ncbi:MAG: fused MFS/spermidine synthase [Bacteroidota bacterium]
MKNENNFPRFIYPFIFLSGLVFLIFEVSWFRLLSLVIGSTTLSSTIVLVSFLSGIGFGAFYWSKKISKIHFSRQLFLLNIYIGISGFASYFAILYGIPIIYLLFASDGGSVIPNIVGYLVAGIVLFVPTFFMGGVLPLISEIASTSAQNISKTLGRIYALETLGSVVGGLITGFILLKYLGQLNTVILASAIVIILGFLLKLTQRKTPIYNIELKNKKSLSQKAPSETTNKTDSKLKIALVATFACGFMVVSMQVIWLRFFKVYFVNTSYTFALISSMVILGLFLGSWLFSARTTSIKNKTKTLFISLLLMSVFSLIGFWFLMNLPSIIMFPLATTEEAYFLRILIIPVIAAILIILPLTIVSGFCFPLIWSIVTEDHEQIGKHVGLVIFSNSMGSVLGPIITTFVLIPWLGGALSIFVLVILLLIVSVWILSKESLKKSAFFLKYSLIGAIVCLFILVIIHPKFYILPPSFSKFEKKILSYHETLEGTYIVGQESDKGNPVISTYVNNSSVIGSTYDAIKAVKLVGHLPFLMGLQCDRALVIGFGIGVTTSAIASHSEVKKIDCIELISDLKEVAHYYKELNNSVYLDPRLNIKTGDGRHFLQSSTQKYDLISSDPTHPILGSGNIYTKEYFELCKAHLTDRGMISQYLPIHKLRLSDFLGLIKTFKSVFPDATIWIGQYHAILIASKQGNCIPIDFNRWKLEASKLTPDIYFYSNPYHLASCLALDSEQIDEITENATINTDDKSYVEFFSFDAFKSTNLPENLAYLNQHRGGVNRAFYNIDDPQMMSRFIYGNQLLTEGIIEMLKNNDLGYKAALELAHQSNPENEEFSFLLKLNFSGDLQ